MSGHRTRPGLQPRRPAHRAIVAATAAIILLAVGACTSTSTPGNAGAPAAEAAAASTGPGGHKPGAGSYPISGYSWALVYTRQHNPAKGQALVAMLDWLTHDGQASAAASGYVPLPSQIRQLARTMIQQITGPAGTPLLG
jgi:phosphate transport system substrate-binding protein